MSTSTPSGSPSGAPHEDNEHAQLEKAVEIISKVAEAGEKSGFAVDTVAEAAYLLKTSALTAPFRMAWNALPAVMQREFAAANQTAAGEWLIRYFPMLNLRSYFVPGLLVAGMATLGVVPFKLNNEEESNMAAELGESADEAAKSAYISSLQEKVVEGITLPYEGAAGALTGKLGKVAGTVVPELKPVVIAAHGAEALDNAKSGYCKQVRERVYALELEAAKAKDEAVKEAAEVPAVQAEEHHEVALADPEAVDDHAPANNNGDIPPLTFDPNTTDGSYYGPVGPIQRPANHSDNLGEEAAA